MFFQLQCEVPVFLANHIPPGGFGPKQIQIFDLHAQKEWPAGEVAKSLGVSLAKVYVTKHRVAAALRKEMEKMERFIQFAYR